MNKKQQSNLETAPDFTLTDTRGEVIQLSAFTQGGPVVLVLARGFA